VVPIRCMLQDPGCRVRAAWCGVTGQLRRLRRGRGWWNIGMLLRHNDMAPERDGEGGGGRRKHTGRRIKGLPGPFLYLGGADLHGLVAAGRARGRGAAPAQSLGASEAPCKVQQVVSAVRQFPPPIWTYGRSPLRPTRPRGGTVCEPVGQLKPCVQLLDRNACRS